MGILYNFYNESDIISTEKETQDVEQEKIKEHPIKINKLTLGRSLIKAVEDAQARLSELQFSPGLKALEDTQARFYESLNFSGLKALEDVQARLSELQNPLAFKSIFDTHVRFYESLNSPGLKALEHAQTRLSEFQFSPGLKALEDTQARFYESLNSPGLKALEDVQVRISNLISKELVFDNWAKTNVQLFDFINRRISFVDRVDSKILPVLKNYNWFITVSLEDDFILSLSRIIEKPKGELSKAIRQEFVIYFSKNKYQKLASMIKSWENNPLFKPRMKIFRDSYNLLKHSHNSYNPSNFVIPTLISQIDGILTDYLIQNEFTIIQKGNGLVWTDKMNKNNWGISKRNKIFKDIFDPNIIEYSLPNGSMSSAALGIGNNFILNTLFQTAYTKQKLENPFGLSRHKIMHGEHVRYGRNDHLIRSYLILDFLYGLEDVDYNDTR